MVRFPGLDIVMDHRLAARETWLLHLEVLYYNGLNYKDLYGNAKYLF